MTTTQPKWKIVANLGDADPYTYGGAFVQVDETGVYDPEMAYWEDQSDFPEDTPITIYRFDLPRCTFINGVLSENRFHPECAAWFADDLEGVAKCCDWELEHLRSALCSESALERAHAYLAILSYHGAENFDSYPITLSVDEVRERYRIVRK